MYKSLMLINARPVASLSGKVDIIYNPATREPVAEVSVGSRQDARMALEAAKKAFPTWSKTSSQKRAELLHAAADIVRERSEMIARLLTLEQGKPLKNARMEILSSAEVLDYYAEEGKRNIGEWITSSNSRSIVLRQPIGVAALITPWNFPVDLLPAAHSWPNRLARHLSLPRSSCER
jgi:acyl-CoA reductase-like NAD-dependent aldehyde dehydrogenase